MGSGVMDRKLPGFKQWVAGSMGRRIDGDRSSNAAENEIKEKQRCK